MHEHKKFGKKCAGKMDDISKTVFAPAYPEIAKDIARRLETDKGVCIDIGSGPGALAIAVANETDFSIISFDSSADMQKKAGENINEAGLCNRISLLQGDVHDIPLDDDYADLIISRGSIFFWDDINTAFKEIYRILKPGVNITAEELNKMDPEKILISGFLSSPASDFINYCHNHNITARAVRSEEVYNVPAGWDFGSPRWILGFMFIANIIHPEIFSFDLKNERSMFYKKFYGIESEDLVQNRDFSRPAI